MFADSGTINNPNFTKHILRDDCFKLFKDMSKQVLQFNTTIMQLYGLYNQNRGQTVWKPLEQIQLPSNESTAKTKLMELLEKETALGGEGIMLRSPNSIWHPKRTGQLLKVKKLEDSEARVIGWVAGLGKLSGLFGALIVDWNGKTFELSGFTDDERAVNDNGWARLHPGEVGPDQYWPVKFRKGCTIRFMYRGLTDSGLPREARYLR
jgi:ATP-dependent DNA ligase